MTGKISIDSEEYKAAIKALSPHRHIIDSRQFNPRYIYEIISLTDQMKEGSAEYASLLKGKIVAMLFYEPSTRTRFSFESAAKRLGAETISTENAKEFSSAAKGETLEDSIKVVSGYADFIVMRHPADESSYQAAIVSKVPVINAGSGKAQHPTQALLDIYTIYENKNTLEDLNICVVGDLFYGRTVASLVYLMSKFRGNNFSFVSPEGLRIKPGLKEHLEEEKCLYTETDDLESALKTADIVYMTRVQKERMNAEEYEKAKGKFVITPENIRLMKQDARLMHPLPRVGEIDPQVDSDPRAIYFDQALNGLYVRMALLDILSRNNGKA